MKWISWILWLFVLSSFALADTLNTTVESNDGFVYKITTSISGLNASWDNARNSTTGNYLSYNGTSFNVKGQITDDEGGYYITDIRRAFFQVDTSSLPDSVTINSATFFFYVEQTTSASSNVSTVALTEAWQDTLDNNLSTDDYGKVDIVDVAVLSNNKTVADLDASMVTRTLRNLTLNAAGLAWINPLGYTNFSLRIGYDIADDPQVQSDSLQVSSYESGYPAYITIVYDTNIAPVVENVTILPDASYTTEKTCDFDYYDVNPIESNWTRWYLNDSLISVTAEILGTGNFSAGDTIKCSKMAFDGTYNATAWVNSSNMTIIDDVAPVITEVGITNTSGYSDISYYLWVNCSDLYGIETNYPMVSFIDPNSVTVGNLSTIWTGTQYYLGYVFSTVGNYTDFKFYCRDTSGNEAQNLTNNITFTSSTNSSTTIVIVDGGGGGGGAILQPSNVNYTFKLVVSNYFAEESKQVAIKPSDTRTYCLDAINFQNDKVQEVKLSCVVPQGSARSDICTWITFDKQSVVVQPSGEIRETVCFEISTPASIVIGEQYVVLIRGTSDLTESTHFDHKITFWVTDYSLFIKQYFLKATDTNLIESLLAFIQENISPAASLNFKIPNIAFPLIWLNQLIFFMTMMQLTKQPWLIVLSQMVLFLSAGIASMFFLELLVSVTVVSFAILVWVRLLR
jgi:hypothetical protein